MNRMEQAARNSGWVFIGRGAERLIRIVVVVVLARILGVRGFGVYSFVFAFAEVFAIFTDVGLQTVLVREIARDRDSAPRLLGSALVLKAVMAASCWAAACLIAIWIIPAGESLWSALAASLLLFVSFRVTSLRTILDAPFEAGLRMAVPIRIGVMTELASAACLIAAALARWPLPALIGVQLGVLLPGGLWLGLHFFREAWPVIRFDPRHWLGLLRMAIPIGAANIFLIAYTRSDLLMLEWLSGESSVGMYSAAYKLTGSLAIVPIAITVSLLPMISRAFEEGDGEMVRKMYRGAASLAVAAGLPILIGGLIFSREIIGAVYGPKFAPAADALSVLGVATVLSFVLYVMTTTGVAVGRAGLFTVYAGALALLNIVLNAALIPSFDFLGASWATLIAEGFMLAAGLAVLRPEVGLPSGGAALRAAGAAAASAAVLAWVPAPLGANLFIALVLYATLVYKGRGLTPEGVAAVQSLFVSKFRHPRGE